MPAAPKPCLALGTLAFPLTPGAACLQALFAYNLTTIMKIAQKAGPQAVANLTAVRA